jgi:hypothetical protein
MPKDLMPDWSQRHGWEDVEVYFVGRCVDESGAAENGLAWLSARLPPEIEMATAQQVHSATVLDARGGCAGEGDALVSAAHHLALAVVTADCVPVLVASRRQLAAIHAGWRGLEAGVIAAAVQRFEGSGLVAWLGPAIGPCCYEVGADVAERIAAVSHPSVVLRGGERPHLSLLDAAVHQLEGLGVEVLHRAPECTRCGSGLWSYRRDGQSAGRNVAAIRRGR